MKSLPHTTYNAVRKLALSFAGVVCFLNVVAQTPEQEYHVSKYFTDEYRPMIEADSSVFYSVTHRNEDSFSSTAEYALGFVGFARRGVGYYEHSTTLDGVPLHSGSKSLLSRLGLTQKRVASMATSESLTDCGRGGTTQFCTDFAEPYGTRTAGINLATRGYNGGVRASINESLGRGWSLAAVLAGRTGLDLHVDGVFTNGVDLGFSIAKRWRGEDKFALTALFSPSERGMRSASSQEAFRLTGNNHYNPSWGLQAGKMRNANIRRSMLPAIVASYDVRLGENTELKVALGAEVGERSYSALAWFDAQTPMPDNYRYMPSYYAITNVSSEVEQAWRECDPRYTQINWDELYKINRMNGRHAVYAVEKRIERVTDLHIRAAGRTRIGESATVRYGVAYSMERSRNFKQMSDLLGSDHIVDIDYFLVDDQSFGNNLQNNLREPNRRIGEGDRYGYDYALVTSTAMVNGGVEWQADRLRLDCEVSVGDRRTHRHGYFEKELFPGAQSFGQSRVVRFTPYAVRIAAGYALTAKHHLALSAAVHSEAPEVENLFLQSRYNNRVIDNPTARTEMSAEFSYRLHSKSFNLDATLFAALSEGGVRVAHYYDDLSATYSNMVVSEISQMRLGVEVVATARFARHWSASLAAVAGYYGYAKDALISLYSDSDNTLLCNHAVAHMGGIRTGNTPLAALSANVAYSSRSWGIRLTANYAALRYVEAEPMRRTDRVSHQASVSEEIFRRFTVQERLPDAVTADISAWKSFQLRSKRGNDRSQLRISLSVRNLLGNDNIIYSARESLRIYRRSIAGDYLYEPFPTRYTYAYPRTYYLGIIYRF